jgi:ribosome maturation protein Sdo1
VICVLLVMSALNRPMTMSDDDGINIKVRLYCQMYKHQYMAVMNMSHLSDEEWSELQSKWKQEIEGSDGKETA